MKLDPIIVLGIIAGYIFSFFLGKYVIQKLIDLKYGQNIREDGPQEHLRKAGTPTMGGIIFLMSTIVLSTVFVLVSVLKSGFNKSLEDVIVILIAFLMFSFIGFLDDYIKIVKKRNLGLTSKQKIILQFVFSLILAIILEVVVGIDHNIIIPFIGQTLNIGLLYIPFVIFVFIATTNSVNLSDGLDGLCTSVSVIVISFLGIVAIQFDLNGNIAIIMGIALGSLLGFLRYNAFPAQVFMGDTGSLGIGGLIAMTAIIFKLELFIAIIGGMYVLEAVSVIIQVFVYKRTKKRFFRMAPIHHHFEKGGMSETKIVTMFSILTLFLCLIAFIAV